MKSGVWFIAFLSIAILFMGYIIQLASVFWKKKQTCNNVSDIIQKHILNRILLHLSSAVMMFYGISVVLSQCSQVFSNNEIICLPDI
jgi:hypothetical protein